MEPHDTGTGSPLQISRAPSHELDVQELPDQSRSSSDDPRTTVSYSRSDPGPHAHVLDKATEKVRARDRNREAQRRFRQRQRVSNVHLCMHAPRATCLCAPGVPPGEDDPVRLNRTCSGGSLLTCCPGADSWQHAPRGRHDRTLGGNGFETERIRVAQPGELYSLRQPPPEDQLGQAKGLFASDLQCSSNSSSRLEAAFCIVLAGVEMK